MASPGLTLYRNGGRNEPASIPEKAAATGAGRPGSGRESHSAQTIYPSNVIRIVVPVSASTPPDILARIVADALSDGEGWKVVVENKPGAMSTIGANEVLRQPADGHTIFSVTAPIAAAPALLPNAPFNMDRDFAPLIQSPPATTCWSSIRRFRSIRWRSWSRI